MASDVVGDWVDVPLGRLEQYQRHIDPVPPLGGAAVAAFDTELQFVGAF